MEMKFIQYLNEDIVDELILTLKNDCKKFIKEAHYSLRNGDFLYRGTDNYVQNGLMARRISRLTSRKPLSTSIVVHDMLNKAFENKFGWAVRNGVFTSTQGRAQEYGVSYLFFPIGNYKYCYTEKTGDLFSVINYLKYYYEDLKRYADSPLSGIANQKLEQFYMNMWKYFGVQYKIEKGADPDDIPKAIKVIVDNYTDKNLSVAIDNGLEVSFKCKDYYLVMEEYKHKIMAGLKNEIS